MTQSPRRPARRVGRPREPVPRVLRPAAGHEHAGGDDDDESGDEDGPEATPPPPAQRTAAIAHVDLVWRPSARVSAHGASSVPKRRPVRQRKPADGPKAFLPAAD